jgi:Fe/S biogenesis protein NfuA
MLIKFTDKAREKILGYIKEAGDAESLGIRIAVTGQGPEGFRYEFFLDLEGSAKPHDVVERHEGLTAIIDGNSTKFLDGATIDWKETVEGSGFDVDNPNPPPPPPPKPEINLGSPVAKKVQKIIQEKINPGVASHGGYVELIDVQGDKAYVRLGGGCQGCGMVNVTLKQGIEVMIKEEVPEISQIIDTTDHAGGTNPYYEPGH